MKLSKKIEKTEYFVKKSFTKFPHYSFGHWTVMANHSIKVKDYANKLLNHFKKADKEIILIAALLHDIGKTFLTDPETLHKKHKELNYEVAKKFLKTLKFSKNKLSKIKKILNLKGKGIEEKIIKDADRLAFYADKILYSKFLCWALANNEKAAIKRKSINKLNLGISKKLARKNYLKMKKD